ncbi:unnamed protein product [Mytilus coruscus]|uniref:Uncharacterized protein n=1 Tax=Mytilus coruscus TaxID=42192 RepID=A0A6J8CBI6_MYTCO|nr:unnamed protein product [Mytilus coruscus]
MQYSFKAVSSKPCSTLPGSSLITSLSTCKNDITNHLRNCFLQREGLIKNEDDILRFRGRLPDFTFIQPVFIHYRLSEVTFVKPVCIHRLPKVTFIKPVYIHNRLAEVTFIKQISIRYLLPEVTFIKPVFIHNRLPEVTFIKPVCIQRLPEVTFIKPFFIDRLPEFHISQSSEVSDHCCPFALSQDDQKYSRKYEHSHGRSCTECEQISSVPGLISNAATIAEYESEDQKDEVQYLVNQSKKSIHEWKQHILRTVNQDRARKVVMDNLEKDVALLECDWAMKFLPMQYRESQSKWFSRRGLSWHVGVVLMKTDQNDYQNFTIVHVFDNATQDALTSTSILQDTINHINKENKKIKTLYLRSDNAGCFHSLYSLTTIPMINKKSLIKIKRVDFSDPQGGECICDRKAAHIKGHIKRNVNDYVCLLL